MRVLHIVHQYPPEHVGGTELYTQAAARALAGQGHDVAVFYRRSATGEGLERWREEGVDVWAAWAGEVSPTQRFLASFGDQALDRAFGRVLEITRPDLVHIQHLMGLPVGLVRYLRRAGVPYIISLHDYWWACANAQLLTNDRQRLCDGPRAYLNCARCGLARAGRPGLWPAVPPLAMIFARRNGLLRQVMAEANLRVAASRFVHDWYALRACGPSQSADRSRLVILPLGVDRPLARREGEREGPLRFVYIGGLAWQKGVHVLVEAFAGIKGRAELWIAGDQSANPEYAARLRAQAAAGVRFLGRLDRGQVFETLAQADVVAVPSLWHETFSLIVSEAFASQTPVIASRVGALAERVRDGEDGLLVASGDVAAWRAALQQLTDDLPLVQRLRANVKPPITVAEHVARLEVLYRQAASGVG